MAYREQLSGYVKFLRGTPAAWASLETKNADTLYFISEDGATSGTLYLGSKLISGSGAGSIASLSNIGDVNISGSPVSNAILKWNSTTQKWEAVSLDSAVGSVVTQMTGATAAADGLAGLVPTPLAGDHIKFLRGDGTWAEIDVQTAIDEAIADLVDGAPAAFDTLKEIADWIENNPGAGDVSTSLAEINNALYGENASAQDKSDLYNSIKSQGIISTLNSLSNTVDGHTTQITNLSSSVSALEDKLKWVDLVVDSD